jgi:DNA repair photolyase
MRWHEQLETKHRSGQLPGIDDGTVVRTFDAPEALTAQFHEIHAKSALNRVPGASKLPFGWTVNTYRGCLHRCAFCFARPTHEYLGFNAAEDFDRQIVVKVNAPELLRAELRRPSWRFEHVALGTNTDPYQWVEKQYGLTRAVLEVLRDAHNPCSVLTKSPLLLRDLDLFKEIQEVAEFSACLSIPTLDEKAWRSTEPGTPHPRKRLEAVAALNGAGIPTGVLVAPLMPGINDSDEQVAAVVEACREAGATRVGGQALFLRGSTKDVFMGYLRASRPDLVPMYEQLYGKRTWLSPEDRKRVEAPLRRRAQRYVPELAARFQRCSENPDQATVAGRLPGEAAADDQPLSVVRGGRPAGAETRFRGYAIGESGRPPAFASPRGAPPGPGAAPAPSRAATAAEVATGLAAARDVLDQAERWRPQPTQEALF